jgi:hypothetical protein
MSRYARSLPTPEEKELYTRLIHICDRGARDCKVTPNQPYDITRTGAFAIGLYLREYPIELCVRDGAHDEKDGSEWLPIVSSIIRSIEGQSSFSLIGERMVPLEGNVIQVSVVCHDAGDRIVTLNISKGSYPPLYWAYEMFNHSTPTMRAFTRAVKIWAHERRVMCSDFATATGLLPEYLISVIALMLQSHDKNKFSDFFEVLWKLANDNTKTFILLWAAFRDRKPGNTDFMHITYPYGSPENRAGTVTRERWDNLIGHEVERALYMSREIEQMCPEKTLEEVCESLCDDG